MTYFSELPYWKKVRKWSPVVTVTIAFRDYEMFIFCRFFFSRRKLRYSTQEFSGIISAGLFEFKREVFLRNCFIKDMQVHDTLVCSARVHPKLYKSTHESSLSLFKSGIRALLWKRSGKNISDTLANGFCATFLLLLHFDFIVIYL